MLTSIHIQGFKGFKDTKIEPLRRVNLIVGGQNSGKTSLLEAIEVGILLDTGAYRQSPLNMKNYITSFLQNSIFRLQVGKRQADSVAHTVPCSIDTIYSNQTQNYRIKPFPFSVYPVGEQSLATIFETAVKDVENETEEKILSALKKIEPRLKTIKSVSADGESHHSLHVNIGLKKLTPLSMLGQGFNRLTYLYSSLLGQSSDCALIDELENGIHYSALPTVWQGIANIARELDIQLFITTHSYECIQAATKVFEAMPEEFQVIRLERTEDNVLAKCIPSDRVASVLERGWEIR